MFLVYYKVNFTGLKMVSFELSEREKSILRFVVHQFILTANPVGSRNITKRYELGVSPATVRNIMSDLEEFGLLEHPHTSAGRVPTDKGYRLYVDSLMDPPALDSKEKDYINGAFEKAGTDPESLLNFSSLILSEITHQLACITYPAFDSSILEKIHLVPLASTRLLVVLNVSSGAVKTITLEIESEISSVNLDGVQGILNEKLAGLTFDEIKQTFSQRVKDYLDSDLKPVLRLFVDSIDKIFTDPRMKEQAIITGAKNFIKQPEFEDLEHFQSIIELIEDKDIIIHLMEKSAFIGENPVSIFIGAENERQKYSEYSLIIKPYKLGGKIGTLGVVGPRRMEYSKVVAAVQYVAELLTKEINE